MTSIPEEVNAVYLHKWNTSLYSNFAMLRHILNVMYPGSDNPWKEFFQFCDEKSAKPKADYGKTTWEWANKKIIFKLSGKNPPALEPIPDYLWAEGNGLCTSFAIEVNEATATHGGYVEYASKHRAVQKTIGADVLLIDSSVGMAIQLKEDAEFEKWHHVESGKVSWDKNMPVAVWNSAAAMKACLDQIWRKSMYAVTYYREISNGRGTFGRMIQFSAWHRAFKMVAHSAEGLRIRYLVFGIGKAVEIDAAYREFARTASAESDVSNRIVVAEMCEIFAVACEHWGAPTYTKWQLVDQSGPWPPYIL